MIAIYHYDNTDSCHYCLGTALVRGCPVVRLINSGFPPALQMRTAARKENYNLIT